ncbi:hypothetical protein BC938DRAFT_471383, partial [Jimgerdemannia flammicorona]
MAAASGPTTTYGMPSLLDSDRSSVCRAGRIRQTYTTSRETTTSDLATTCGCRRWIDSGDVFTPAVNFLDAVSTPTLPRILLTHVPLYRPDSTSCGPLRRMQNTINQGTGHQYQNLVTPELTTRILRTTRPNLVFSGDDHDYCEIRHYEEIEKPGEMGGRVQIDAVEVTVSTFSMAQGVRRPGYVLLSLFNPDTLKSSPEEPDRPREIPEMPVDGGTPTFMHVLCLLPDQLVVYAGYGVMAGLTILAILGVAVTRFQAGLERAMGNREEFEMPLFLGRGGEGGYE